MDHPLYLLRKTLGLTQEQLGAEIGVTGGRVSQIEGGAGRLSDARLLALVDKYRVELARLGISTSDFLRPQGADAASGAGSSDSVA